MGDKEAKEGLRGMLQSPEGRSETARLADMFEEIEAALQKGFTHKAILASLHKNGFTLTLDGFQTALYRLRKRKAARTPSSAPTAPKTETKQVPQVLQESTPKPIEPEVQTEEDQEFEAFKKSVAHLPIIQRSKKIADFLEKQQESKMSPSTRKWLGES